MAFDVWLVCFGFDGCRLPATFRWVGGRGHCVLEDVRARCCLPGIQHSFSTLPILLIGSRYVLCSGTDVCITKLPWWSCPPISSFVEGKQVALPFALPCCSIDFFFVFRFFFVFCLFGWLLLLYCRLVWCLFRFALLRAWRERWTHWDLASRPFASSSGETLPTPISSELFCLFVFRNWCVYLVTTATTTNCLASPNCFVFTWSAKCFAKWISMIAF